MGYVGVIILGGGEGIVELKINVLLEVGVQIGNYFGEVVDLVVVYFNG